MKTLLLTLAAPAALLSLAAATAPAAEPAPFHCQVPCGIYGDTLRIDLLHEDAATIEKGMAQLVAFQAEESPNLNQVVRWTTTKDEHAQKIQDQVMDYWLAQRVKFPKDEAGRARYLEQLERLHQVTVHAMKCKQTTDASHVAALRASLMAFATSYFGPEDLDHIRQHHGADHK